METEEIITTTEEEETLDETKPLEETKEESSEPTESEEKNKRLYARAKKAEEENKTLKASLAEREVPNQPVSDVFDLAKAVSSLKDYGPEELDFIQMISKAKSISPEEAAQTDEAKLYIAARRTKVEEEKSKLEPSTKQSPTEKSVNDVTSEDIKKMTVSQKEEFLKKIGWGKESYKKR